MSVDGLIDYIVTKEAAGNWGNYQSNIRAKGFHPPKPITQMTVGEVLAWQQQAIRFTGFSAAGGIQMIRKTLQGHVRKGTVSPDDVYDVSTQKRLAMAELEGAGLSQWQAGGMSDAQFGTNVAKVWAGVPVLMNTSRNGKPVAYGSSYYAGVAGNRAGGRPEEFIAVLNDPSQYTGARMSLGDSEMRRALTGPWQDQSGIEIERGEDYAPVRLWDNAADRLMALRPRDIEPRGTDPRYRPINGGGIETRPLDGGDPSDVDGPYQWGIEQDASHERYQTPQGGGYGAYLTGTWGEEFRNAWRDDPIVRAVTGDGHAPGIAGVLAGEGDEIDLDFDIAAKLKEDGLTQHFEFFKDTRNAAHYEHKKQMLSDEKRRVYEDDATDAPGAALAGGLLQPSSVATFIVPGTAAVKMGRAGVSALRSGISVGAMNLGMEAGFEMMRRNSDPDWSATEGVLRVGGAGLLGGLMGGVLGGWVSKGAQRGMADNIVREAAEAQGVPSMPSRVGGRKVDARGDGSPTGPMVFHLDDGLEVNAPAVEARFEATGGRSEFGQMVRPEQLARAEAAKTASMADSLTAEFGTTRAVVDVADLANMSRADLEELFDFGRRFGWKVKDETGTVRDFSEVRQASDLARPATPNDRIRQGLADRARTREQREAVAAAGRPTLRDAVSRFAGDESGAVNLGGIEGGAKKAAEKLRAARDKAVNAGREEADRYAVESDKLIRSRSAQMVARMQDSPFKRLHRNSINRSVRDLASKLAGDGAFLSGEMQAGKTVGASVAMRAKTWEGVVRKLWDTETELYYKMMERMSGQTVNRQEFGDIPLAKTVAAVARPDGLPKIEVFRDRASKALITGKADPAPEVNEMAQHLRGAWAEYEEVAKRYGVLGSKDMLGARIAKLKQKIEWLQEREMNGGGDYAEDLLDLNGQLGQLEQMLKMASDEPGKDYFTRIWNHHKIRENREAFKENVVKPWMRQQPWVDVWAPGKAELRAELKKLEAMKLTPAVQRRIDEIEARIDDAPNLGEFQRVKATGDIDARADELIDQILQEAEPDELMRLREAHRPVFGRTRQFDVPNSMLLKDGPMGNGIDDFIETDYLLVHRVYAERMGPAIEMARTFARPVDGITGQEGFEEAVYLARKNEERAFFKDWWKKNPPETKGRPTDAEKKAVVDAFEAHWSPMERDLSHLRDVVTNRVARNPERWDNRTAAVLKNMSHLVLMGAAAVPATVELGTLIMRHGAHRVFGQILGETSQTAKAAFQANRAELKLSGAVMEVVMGGALSRFAQTGIDPANVSRPEALLRTAANKMFLFNGLAPLSSTFRQIDGAVRVHDMVERIDRVAGGNATKADLEELARYGIDEDTALNMGAEPIQQTDDGIWTANTEAWGDEDLVRTFRAAIRQGNENTILLASAADKPMIVDGVMFIKKRPWLDGYAVQAGLEEAGDYWRVQSGLASLPFLYWNYALAATNKILVQTMDEPSMRAASGIAAMIGMGTLAAYARSGDSWDSYSTGDRIQRAIDMSGVMGAVPNMLDLAQKGVIGLTGQNPLPFSPRHSGPNMSRGEALFSMAGAGPTVARNALVGAATGDMERLSWGVAPGRNHLLLKGIWDALVSGENTDAGPPGSDYWDMFPKDDPRAVVRGKGFSNPYKAYEHMREGGPGAPPDWLPHPADFESWDGF